METAKVVSQRKANENIGIGGFSDTRPLVTRLTMQYALSILMVGAATMIAAGFDRHVTIPNLSLIYVIPVIVSAVMFGFGPSIFSSVLGALAYNFFFTEPRFTLEVDDPANVRAIGLLFGVGRIASAVASTARRRADRVSEVKRQQVALRAFGQHIAAAPSIGAVMSVTADLLDDLFDCPVAVIFFNGNEAPQVERRGSAVLSAIEMEAAQASAETGQFVKSDVYPFDASRFDFWPAPAAEKAGAAIGVAFTSETRPAEPDVVIEIVSSVLALGIARLSVGTPS